MLKFELNVEERKTLAKRMEELTGIHPYYTKAPRYAYDIGNYTIDRDGNLLVEAENADLELLTTLMNEGLISGGEDVDAETLQETADEQPAVDLAEGVQMIPAVHPNEQETCEGDSEEAEEDGESEMESAEQIPSEEGEEQPVAEEAIPLDADFSFPISQHNGVSLCLAMSQLAKMVRTASPKPQQTDNEKYAMRCWMLRLGFIGDEFATAREILLRNMEGNASWRNK